MTRALPKWLMWLPAAVLVVAVGGALWYASSHGWFDRLTSKRDAAPSGQAGMDMQMPGMNAGPSNATTESPGMTGRAAVEIPPALQQRIGVTVGQVEKAPLRMSVRTVGIVRANETKVARIHLRTEGWVEKLFVNFVGQQVKKGDPLLSIYSPEFLNTQQEYLNARKGNQDSLAELARQRLELWDVPADAVDELARTGKPKRTLTLNSPMNGTVLEKKILEKERVTPEKELYVLADLSTVWVQAKVYEYELPHVDLDQPATVTLPALPDKTFTGKVVFIHPIVEEKTRTVQVRVELPNEKRLLKPGMFADVVIEHTMGAGLLVPTSAIVRTGEQDIAFRVESQGRFVPVVVKISAFKFGDRFHVLEGLKAEDRVVTSATFLIDSESRLRAGGGMMMPGMPGMDMGDMKGMDHSKMKK